MQYLFDRLNKKLKTNPQLVKSLLTDIEKKKQKDDKTFLKKRAKS